MKQKQKIKEMLFLSMLSFFVFLSCSNKDDIFLEHDPSKSIEVTKFFPDSGGIRTKIILEGSNFGTDTSKVSVYFNEKKATVINAQGERLYALVPRLPGDECIVTVKIGDATVAYKDIFRYKEQLMVSTVAGARNENLNEYQGGSLSSTTFPNLWGLVIDNDDNIFVSMNGSNDASKGVARINELEYLSTWISNDIPNRGGTLFPTIDPKTQIIYFPSDNEYSYIELNPVNMWIPKIRDLTVPQLTPQEIAEGKTQIHIQWKHSFAYCTVDKKIYTRSHVGQIIRFDPNTREAEFFTNDGNGDTQACLAFDPLEPHMLYISYASRHCLYRFDTRLDMTAESKGELFTGFRNSPGSTDGEVGVAEFDQPRQFAFDKEGIIYLADMKNFTIRRIERDGRVSLAAGSPNKWGIENGPPLEARFDNPTGLAISKDGHIYIAENSNNRMLRKLTLE